MSIVSGFSGEDGAVDRCCMCLWVAHAHFAHVISRSSLVIFCSDIPALVLNNLWRVLFQAGRVLGSSVALCVYPCLSHWQEGTQPFSLNSRRNQIKRKRPTPGPIHVLQGLFYKNSRFSVYFNKSPSKKG